MLTASLMLWEARLVETKGTVNLKEFSSFFKLKKSYWRFLGLEGMVEWVLLLFWEVWVRLKFMEFLIGELADW